MLKQEYSANSESDIAHKNYSLIKSQPDSPLARYVSENMTQYTEIILFNCNNDICDDEIVAISLLNDADVEEAAKKQYIALLSTAICDVTQVNESSLWVGMISHGVLRFSENNFVSCFQEQGMDALLAEYINRVLAEVDFSSVTAKFGEKISNELFSEVAISNNCSFAHKMRKMALRC